MRNRSWRALGRNKMVRQIIPDNGYEHASSTRDFALNARQATPNNGLEPASSAQDATLDAKQVTPDQGLQRTSSAQDPSPDARQATPNNDLEHASWRETPRWTHDRGMSAKKRIARYTGQPARSLKDAAHPRHEYSYRNPNSGRHSKQSSCEQAVRPTRLHTQLRKGTQIGHCMRAK